LGGKEDAAGMRSYWDEGARRNALWYVDTSLDYDDPDLDRFFETGRTIVSEALGNAPVKPAEHQLAVEIGSGLGRVCKALAGDFDRVIGIDISSEMIKRAEELVQDPKVEFLLGNGVSLEGIETASVDLVLSFTVFQHIPKVSVICDYLAESGRVLKPGGVLVFQWNNEPGARWWSVRRAILSAMQRTHLRPETYSRHAPQFLGSRVPVRQLEPGLERGRLELKEVRGAGTLYAWAWAQRRP
jgi:SAM-dependent methyltransferase